MRRMSVGAQESHSHNINGWNVLGHRDYQRNLGFNGFFDSSCGLIRGNIDSCRIRLEHFFGLELVQ